MLSNSAPSPFTNRTMVEARSFADFGLGEPAADALLAKLLSTQPIEGASIIALGQHVDYWDRLGWRDRFSSAALTNRQQVYGTAFNTESIYTPQMVVDGASEFVGSDTVAARKTIAKAAGVPHGTVRIAVEPVSARQVSVDVSASDLPKPGRGDPRDILVAITEDGLKSDVKRGENHGRILTHAAQGYSQESSSDPASAFAGYTPGSTIGKAATLRRSVNR